MRGVTDYGDVRIVVGNLLIQLENMLQPFFDNSSCSGVLKPPPEVVQSLLEDKMLEVYTTYKVYNIYGYAFEDYEISEASSQPYH